MNRKVCDVCGQMIPLNEESVVYLEGPRGLKERTIDMNKTFEMCRGCYIPVKKFVQELLDDKRKQKQAREVEEGSADISQEDTGMPARDNQDGS